MSSALTVHDVMTREFLGVSEGDDFLETVSLLLEDGTECAVVLRGRDPVGVMTERDALSVVAGGIDPASATVSDAMSGGVVRIRPGRSLGAAARAMSREGVGWLVATEGEPVGVITAFDVVAATTMAPDADTEPVTATTTDPEAEYDTHGICEVCGGLASGLTSHNGQLVCQNCRDD